LTFAYTLSTAVAALLVITSIAGLLFGRRGLYDLDPSTLPAFLGQDGITLLVGLPLLIGSMRLARRGSQRGLLLWMGSLFYFAYSYAYYVLGARFNGLFPAYAAIVAMSMYGLLDLLVATDVDAVKRAFSERTPTRGVGGFLVATSLLFFLLWGVGIASTLQAGAAPSRVSHVVWSLDLVVALPAVLLSGVLLLRRHPWGYVAAGALLLKATFLGFTLVVTTALASFWGVKPDLLQTAAFAALGAGGLALTVRYLRAVGQPTPRPRASVAPPSKHLQAAQP
jgi:hypothetical protein